MEQKKVITGSSRGSLSLSRGAKDAWRGEHQKRLYLWGSKKLEVGGVRVRITAGDVFRPFPENCDVFRLFETL